MRVLEQLINEIRSWTTILSVDPRIRLALALHLGSTATCRCRIVSAMVPKPAFFSTLPVISQPRHPLSLSPSYLRAFS
jgi:hypothetical protein